MYDKKCLDELKGLVSLVEVVAGHISCQRTGQLFKALCPFHQEKTPSFVVKDSSPYYHCFGCGAHGDAISFLMHTQNYSFRDAVEWLADRYGVPLLEIDSSLQQGAFRDDCLIKAKLKNATVLFHWMLFYTKEGRKALLYLQCRGFDISDCLRFHVGYVPNVNPRLIFSKEELSCLDQVGLVFFKGGEYQLSFANRLVFPIKSITGHTLGFTARKISDIPGAKYINSSESRIFKKGDCFFGLDLARSSIARSHTVFLVEGPLDVMRLHSIQMDNVLALMGTALTEQHVARLLSMGVQRVYLAFDGDLPGKLAAKKAGELLIKNLLDVRVIQFSEDMDPDAFALVHGSAGMKERSDNALDYLSFLFRSQFQTVPCFSEKAKWVREVLSMVLSWNDPLLLRTSVGQIAEIAELDPSEVMKMLNNQQVFSITEKEEIQSYDLLEQEWVRLALLLLSFDQSLLKSGLAKVKLSAIFNPHLKRIRSTIEKLFVEGEGPIEIGMGDFLRALSKQDIVTLEKMGASKQSIEKAKQCFRDVSRELVKREWVLEREKMRAIIRGGTLTDQEASQMAAKLLQMTKNPPEAEL